MSKSVLYKGTSSLKAGTFYLLCDSNATSGSRNVISWKIFILIGNLFLSSVAVAIYKSKHFNLNTLTPLPSCKFESYSSQSGPRSTCSSGRKFFDQIYRRHQYPSAPMELGSSGILVFTTQLSCPKAYGSTLFWIEKGHSEYWSSLIHTSKIIGMLLYRHFSAHSESIQHFSNYPRTRLYENNSIARPNFPATILYTDFSSKSSSVGKFQNFLSFFLGKFLHLLKLGTSFSTSRNIVCYWS